MFLLCWPLHFAKAEACLRAALPCIGLSLLMGCGILDALSKAMLALEMPKQ
jgi:hypothetical protein